LYQENHFEPVGPTWQAHHEHFAEFVKGKLNEQTSVLEIGGASGALAELVVNETSRGWDYTIVEPNYTGLKRKFKVVEGFIEDNLGLIPSADAVVHSHVLEHLYSPVATLKSISSAMRVGSRMMVSFPNLEMLLRVGGSNALNFEHTFFLGRSELIEVFGSVGLELESTQDFQSHSFFFCFVKSRRGSAAIDVSKFGEGAERLFIDSWSKIATVANRFNETIQSDSRLTGFLFGAHVFSQGLISQGVNEKYCRAVLDNSPSKLGKRLYGTKLYVEAPKIISQVERPAVALMASHYQEEIKSQLILLNPSVVIIE
jgi:hypothetical protein